MTKKNTQEECITNLKPYHFMHENWSNTDNINIYKNMPIEAFYQGAVQGGLDTGVDVKNLEKYIDKAKSILEVGAGYGRVLSHILNQGYTGKLVAIERDKKFYQFLQSQFYGRVKIFCSDVMNFCPDDKFDLILWVWASIFEFSKNEQAQVVSHLGNMLNKNGLLILDVLPIECVSINATKLNSHDRVIETPYGKDYCYVPSDDEIMRYAQQADLAHCEDLIYHTTVGRERRLSIFCFR
ncbi:MAG: class I SAM-dependent methyltransferase [Gammaproteobacteria bacterium]|jgi:SAM-dependent methyltransferase